MKHTLFILIFISGLTIFGISQSNAEQKDLTGDIRADLKVLLPGQEVTVNIMDGIKYSDRLIRLTGKFQAAVQKNYKWYVDHVKKTPKGQPVPYDKKLGLTKDEYDEFLELAKDIEVMSTGTEKITIKYDADIITFKSKNKLANLNFLTIDLKNNTATFKEYKLPFEDTVKVTSEKNGFKSKWKGYKWRFEEPGNLNTDATKDLDKLKAKIYKLSVGRLEKNGRSILNLKGTEIEDGEKTVEFELTLEF